MVSIARPQPQASSPDDAPAPESGQRGRHKAPAEEVHPHRFRRRRRWPVLVALGALAALIVPPPGQADSLLLAEVSDASLPLGLTSDSTIAYLSSGAPTGSIVLASLPTQTGDQQPVAPTVISGLAANGIPNVALNAYRVAAARMASASPSCGIDWSLLAGIGRVESNHGRYGGAVLNPDGTSTPKILGPPLDGVQFAFIGTATAACGTATRPTTAPSARCSSSRRPGAPTRIDGDGNGVTDPFNINDAALGAAHYLCVAGGNLRTDGGLRKAVLAYNHSDSYVDEVLALARAYASGIPVADIPIVGNTTGAIPPPVVRRLGLLRRPRRSRPGHRPHGHDAALRPHHGAVRLLRRGARRFRRPGGQRFGRQPVGTRRQQRRLRLAAPRRARRRRRDGVGVRRSFRLRFGCAFGWWRWRHHPGRSRPPGACPAGPRPATGPAPAATARPAAAGTGPRGDVHDAGSADGSEAPARTAPLPVTT